MAFKKWVRGVLVGAVAASSVIATRYADNIQDMTAKANAKDAAMELVWADLTQQHDNGALGKQEVVDQMKPHMDELREIEGQERNNILGLFGASAVAIGAGSLLVRGGIGNKKKLDGNNLG